MFEQIKNLEREGHFKEVDQLIKLASTQNLFHITTADRLPNIAAQGLIPNARPMIGSGAGYHGHSQGRIFLSDLNGVWFWIWKCQEWVLNKYTDNEKHMIENGIAPIVLKVQVNSNEISPDQAAIQDRSPGSAFFCENVIPPEHIQFFNGTDWLPIDEYHLLDISPAFDTKEEHDDDEDEDYLYVNFHNPYPFEFKEEGLNKQAAKSLFQLTERKAEGAWNWFLGKLEHNLHDQSFLDALQKNTGGKLLLGSLNMNFGPQGTGGAYFFLQPNNSTDSLLRFFGSATNRGNFINIIAKINVNMFIDYSQENEKIKGKRWYTKQDNPLLRTMEYVKPNFISVFVHEFDHILQKRRPSINAPYTHPSQYKNAHDPINQEFIDYLFSQREIESRTAELYRFLKREGNLDIPLDIHIRNFAHDKLMSYFYQNPEAIINLAPDIEQRWVSVLSNELFKRFPHVRQMYQNAKQQVKPPTPFQETINRIKNYPMPE